MPLPIQVSVDLGLSTRRQRKISIQMNLEPSIHGELLAVQREVATWKDAIHRHEIGPCRTFNCHGLTFASRRTWIDKSGEVQKILDDDGYVEVPLAKVKP